MTRYVDITVPLIPGRVPLYPGDTDLEVTLVQTREGGDPANVSQLVCSLHCGTHVDAPAHFFAGEPGVDSLAVDRLIGPAEVVDATSTRMLDAAALDRLAIPAGAGRLLFRTTNSALWEDPRFTADFVAVTANGAEWLVERGVQLVGIDYLSVASYDDPGPTHEILLRAGVVVVETLDLRFVTPGAWHLTCLPLRIPGADGAPARAVLRRE